MHPFVSSETAASLQLDVAPHAPSSSRAHACVHPFVSSETAASLQLDVVVPLHLHLHIQGGLVHYGHCGHYLWHCGNVHYEHENGLFCYDACSLEE